MTTTATPHQMLMAWLYVTHHGDRIPPYVQASLRDHPPTIADPTYYRDGEGWQSASNIKNDTLIPALRAWLAHGDLAAPEATEAAWTETLRRTAVRKAVMDSITAALDEVDEVEACPVASHYAGAVIEALLPAVAR